MAIHCAAAVRWIDEKEKKERKFMGETQAFPTNLGRPNYAHGQGHVKPVYLITT